jgi:hypothetical protein
MASEWKKCAKCQKELSMLASACPGCGAPRKPPWWAVVSLVALIGLVVIIAAAALGGKKEKPVATEPAATAKPALPDVATGPTVDVTVPNLLAEYRANEVAADAKYRDKIVRVTGIVVRVAKDALGKPIVVLLAPGQRRIHADFATENGLATVNPNDEIVMRCRGGGLYGGDPVLSECVLERTPAGSEPAPR